MLKEELLEKLSHLPLNKFKLSMCLNNSSEKLEIFLLKELCFPEEELHQLLKELLNSEINLLKLLSKERRLKRKSKFKKLKELERKKKKEFRWSSGKLREKNKLNRQRLNSK
jgi:hypothetical protein